MSKIQDLWSIDICTVKCVPNMIGGPYTIHKYDCDEPEIRISGNEIYRCELTDV